ncbi:Copper chaperone [Handroanthus impetiginosus]|uniref:Copper chaperone n=1 Tax=Handroanthus impetiginosus TaxID=429701 RepID=A0A2G9IAI9_9LAMI|nr:Copper chaperone [Handroanthus impetiginosus]
MAETADEPVEPNRLKTCVLRASIHCVGCSKKVKKILRQLQGVESVDVDTKQQKVTVTGSVDADTLIKKLAKSGKQAQLWPQNPQRRDNNDSNNNNVTANGKNKEKLETEETPTKTHHHQQQQQPNPTSDNAAKVDSAAKKSQGSEAPAKEAEDRGGKTHDGSVVGSPAAAKATGESPVKASGGVQEESKSEEEKKKNDEGCSAAGEATEKKETAVEKNNGGGGEGSTSGKKKKKKGQSGNLSTSAPSSAFRESENQESGAPHQTNHNIPRYHYPPAPHHYYTPPQPVYAVSYNTAYPTSSHTTSYYAAPPPYSHAYMQPGPVTEPPPPDPDLHPRQPLDSFEMFSDENPNACSIM